MDFFFLPLFCLYTMYLKKCFLRWAQTNLANTWWTFSFCLFFLLALHVFEKRCFLVVLGTTFEYFTPGCLGSGSVLLLSELITGL